jgi:hypothetical protein
VPNADRGLRELPPTLSISFIFSVFILHHLLSLARRCLALLLNRCRSIRPVNFFRFFSTPAGINPQMKNAGQEGHTRDDDSAGNTPLAIESRVLRIFYAYYPTA